MDWNEGRLGISQLGLIVGVVLPEEAVVVGTREFVEVGGEGRDETALTLEAVVAPARRLVLPGGKGHCKGDPFRAGKGSQGEVVLWEWNNEQSITFKVYPLELRLD